MKANGRILIVDDDSRSVDILCRLLREEYFLKTASTGNECLAMLTEFRPQLVLMDIMMPGISGHEACRRIKFSPLGDSMRIILVSAKETIVDHVRGSDALADDCLLKPFDHEELLAKVHAQFDAMDKDDFLDPFDNAEPLDSGGEMSAQQQARYEAALRKLGTHAGF